MPSPNPADQPGHTTRLVNKLRAGDPAARTLLIEHAQKRLRRLAKRMLQTYPGVRRWEETDDVLQSALLRLHRALGQVVVESSAHFHRLAVLQIRRELLDLAKRYAGPEGLGANHHSDGVGRAADDPGGPLAGAVGESCEPSSLAEWADFHEAVERLPESERDVFLLHWYGGLKFADIADLLSVDEKTVRRRFQKARIILDKAINGG